MLLLSFTQRWWWLGSASDDGGGNGGGNGNDGDGGGEDEEDGGDNGHVDDGGVEIMKKMMIVEVECYGMDPGIIKANQADPLPLSCTLLYLDREKEIVSRTFCERGLTCSLSQHWE